MGVLVEWRLLAIGVLGTKFERRKLRLLPEMRGGDLVHRNADLDFTKCEIASRQPVCNGTVMELRLGSLRNGGKAREQQDLAFMPLRWCESWTQCERSV